MDVPSAISVVLIADDESMVRHVARAMLDGIGYTVLTAEDGFRAVEIVNEFPGDIHVAMCDIRMPGPSGMALRDIIISKRPTTKVALLSGNTSFSDLPSNVVVFPKPFTATQFRQLVREMVEP